jgi:hypothetical protein
MTAMDGLPLAPKQIALCASQGNPLAEHLYNPSMQFD